MYSRFLLVLLLIARASNSVIVPVRLVQCLVEAEGNQMMFWKFCLPEHNCCKVTGNFSKPQTQPFKIPVPTAMVFTNPTPASGGLVPCLSGIKGNNILIWKFCTPGHNCCGGLGIGFDNEPQSQTAKTRTKLSPVPPAKVENTPTPIPIRLVPCVDRNKGNHMIVWKFCPTGHNCCEQTENTTEPLVRGQTIAKLNLGTTPTPIFSCRDAEDRLVCRQTCPKNKQVKDRTCPLSNTVCCLGKPTSIYYPLRNAPFYRPNNTLHDLFMKYIIEKINNKTALENEVNKNKLNNADVVEIVPLEVQNKYIATKNDSEEILTNEEHPIEITNDKTKESIEADLLKIETNEELNKCNETYRIEFKIIEDLNKNDDSGEVEVELIQTPNKCNTENDSILNVTTQDIHKISETEEVESRTIEEASKFNGSDLVDIRNKKLSEPNEPDMLKNKTNEELNKCNETYTIEIKIVEDSNKNDDTGEVEIELIQTLNKCKTEAGSVKIETTDDTKKINTTGLIENETIVEPHAFNRTDPVKIKRIVEPNEFNRTDSMKIDIIDESYEYKETNTVEIKIIDNSRKYNETIDIKEPSNYNETDAMDNEIFEKTNVNKNNIINDTVGPERKSVQYCKKYANLTYDYAHVSPPLPQMIPFSIPMDNCIPRINPLIVGGKNVTKGEYPHMVALGYNKLDMIDYLCGGTLISEKYVLTSGHCTLTIWGYPVVVLLGSTELYSEDSTEIEVENIITHPDYTPTSYYNDIALLELSKEVTFTDYIRPACLVLPDTMSQESGSVNIATGWGRTGIAYESSMYLLKVHLRVLSTTECHEKYYKNEAKHSPALSEGITDSLMCTIGHYSKYHDTCQGDSGGPLQAFIPGHKCVLEVIGIMSFGKTCGTGIPAVYTKVEPFIPWIESIVWD